MVKLGFSPQRSQQVLSTFTWSHQVVPTLVHIRLCKQLCPKSGIVGTSVTHFTLPHSLIIKFFSDSHQCRKVKLNWLIILAVQSSQSAVCRSVICRLMVFFLHFHISDGFCFSRCHHYLWCAAENSRKDTERQISSLPYISLTIGKLL